MELLSNPSRNRAHELFRSLTNCIGSGKYGTVFEQDDIVFKVSRTDLPRDRSYSQSIQKDIRKEFELHSHFYNGTAYKHLIAKPLSIIDGLGFNSVLAIEKIDGVNFYDWIQLSFDKHILLRLVYEVLVFTEELKRLGMRHGDLHGGNILVSNNHIKVIDFGFAEITTDNKTGDYDFLNFIKCIKSWMDQLNISYIDILG